MRKSRFTAEQIIAILAEQVRGETTAEACRVGGRAVHPIKWKAIYGPPPVGKSWTPPTTRSFPSDVAV